MYNIILNIYKIIASVSQLRLLSRVKLTFKSLNHKNFKPKTNLNTLNNQITNHKKNNNLNICCNISNICFIKSIFSINFIIIFNYNFSINFSIMFSIMFSINKNIIIKIRNRIRKKDKN